MSLAPDTRPGRRASGTEPGDCTIERQSRDASTAHNFEITVAAEKLQTDDMVYTEQLSLQSQSVGTKIVYFRRSKGGHSTLAQLFSCGSSR